MLVFIYLIINTLTDFGIVFNNVLSYLLFFNVLIYCFFNVWILRVLFIWWHKSTLVLLSLLFI